MDTLVDCRGEGVWKVWGEWAGGETDRVGFPWSSTPCVLPPSPHCCLCLPLRLCIFCRLVAPPQLEVLLQSQAEAVGQVYGEWVQHDLKAGGEGGAEGASGGSDSDYKSAYQTHVNRLKKTKDSFASGQPRH